MSLELKPVISGGRTVVKRDVVSCTRLGKVAAVYFINGGSVSNLIIEFSGVTITLAPGASWGESAPTFGYLVNDYNIRFELGSGAAARIDKCLINYQVYQEQL